MNDVTQVTLDSSSAPRRTKTASSAILSQGSDLGRRTIHLCLQGKGGVGKTLVASLLLQYCQHTGREVVGYDADPVNESLSSIKALGAKTIGLVAGEMLVVRTADQFVEDLLTCQTDVVLDNGAAGFLAVSSYLVESEIAALLHSAGRDLVIHVVVAGGQAFLDCLNGFDALVQNFPATVRFVVWTNEFFGPLKAKNRDTEVAFEDASAYRNAKDRVVGVVRLASLNPNTFGENFGRMLSRRLTFDEALDPASGFNTVERQRLTMIQREIFEQLARVI
jgi:hypothetical protein